MENIVLYFFGNKKYYETYFFGNKNVITKYIETYNGSITNSIEDILVDFEKKYIKGSNIGIISLGKVSILNNLENISGTLDILRTKYSINRKFIIGCLANEVNIFNKKLPTLKIIEKYGLTPIKSQPINNIEMFNHKQYPFVLKVDGLTGGCGMSFIESKKEAIKEFNSFKEKGLNDIFISDFIEGIEVSFSIFRIGDDFIRLPISFREKSNNELTHPDEKIKITGFNGYFQDYFYKIENLMKVEGIYGAFYLEGIYKDGKINFLEGGTRLSGSTPIRFSSMNNYNIFEQIINFYLNKTILFPVNYSFSVQYGHYITKKSLIDYSKLLSYCFSYKFEDTSLLEFSTKNKKRIRLNFNANTLIKLIKKGVNIGNILKYNIFGERLEKFIFDLKSTILIDNIENEK